jgi:hypothetical protein
MVPNEKEFPESGTLSVDHGAAKTKKAAKPPVRNIAIAQLEPPTNVAGPSS